MSDIVRLSVPLTFWLAAFSAVYGLNGLLCSGSGLSLDAGRAPLVAAALAAVAIQLVLLQALRSERYASPSSFVRRLSLALSIVALLATWWTLLPVAFASQCL